jgi:hypothetical protein
MKILTLAGPWRPRSVRGRHGAGVPGKHTRPYVFFLPTNREYAYPHAYPQIPAAYPASILPHTWRVCLPTCSPAYPGHPQALSYPAGGVLACAFDRGCDDPQDQAIYT